MADIQPRANQNSAFSDEEIAMAEKEADKCGDRFTTDQVLGSQAAKGQLAGGYQVVWLPSARSQLPQAGSGASGVAESVGKLLQNSPATQGEELLGRARLVATDTWQVLYRVDEPDKLVTVLGVKPTS